MVIAFFPCGKEISLSLRALALQNNLYKNQKFHGERIQIVYNRGRIWIKILDNKSNLQEIYKQVTLRKLEKTILSFKKFSEVLNNSEVLKEKHKKEAWDL